jgi:hypothetical protein
MTDSPRARPQPDQRPAATVPPPDTVRAALGRLSALSVFLFKCILYGAFVWARRTLEHQKRRFPARAVRLPRPLRRPRILRSQVPGLPAGCTHWWRAAVATIKSL